MDIAKLNTILDINPYFAYEILSNFTDDVLIQLERAENYRHLFTPIGLNAIYQLRFSKLPLTEEQFSKIRELQRETNISWKNIYLILQPILQLADMNMYDETDLSSEDMLVKERLMNKLCSYIADNDDLLPLKLMSVFNLKLGDYRFELLNKALVRKARNTINYIVNKLNYDIVFDDVNASIFAGDLEWFK